MGIFSNLFGSSESTSAAYSKNYNASIWPAKFLTMAITEVGGEPVTGEQLRDVIGDIYPNLQDEDYTTIAVSVSEMHNLVDKSKDTWDNLWDNFCSQLQNYKNSETFAVAKKVACTAFLIKMVEEMNEISNNYTYRIGKDLERNLNLSKHDFINILNEEKENSGYNSYLDSLEDL